MEREKDKPRGGNDTDDHREDDRRVIDSLRRGYLEADEELEAERRARRRARAAAAGSGGSVAGGSVAGSVDSRRHHGSSHRRGGSGNLASLMAAPIPLPAQPSFPVNNTAGSSSSNPPAPSANNYSSQFSTPTAVPRVPTTGQASGALRVARASDSSVGDSASDRVRGTTKILLHRTGAVDVESVSAASASNQERVRASTVESSATMGAGTSSSNYIHTSEKSSSRVGASSSDYLSSSSRPPARPASRNRNE